MPSKPSCRTGVAEWWTLFLLGCIYTVGELGHFLLGSVSRPMAQELHFGDKACLKSSKITHISSDVCSSTVDEIQCGNISVPFEQEIKYPCTWDYTGLGLEYHILAGPAFVAVFTVCALFWGTIADKWNRVKCLSVATIGTALSIVGSAFATQYWHVFVSRMSLAAWESSINVFATGIIADLFPKRQRGLAIGLFHWGIYIGYGSSFSIGNHVTAANIFDAGWRSSYVVSGLPGLILGVALLLTAKEPVRTNDDDEPALVSASSKKKLMEKGWNTIKNPAMILLIIGACVRHAGGFCWGYNSALYFKTYYPDYDVSMWLSIISIGAGISGVFLGGWLSDTLVDKQGISARALVLFVSQLIATPFAFAQFFVSPPTALYFLLCGYLAAELWFGVMFALLIELVEFDIRSKAVAVALFFINNVGGSTPVLVSPIAQATSYRTAILFLYPGALFTSSILFFICWLILKKQKNAAGKSQITKSCENI